MKASVIDYLVDAGPLVAHLDSYDQWHKWATSAIRALGETLHTTEAVITEVSYLLRKYRPAVDELLRLTTEGVIQVHPVFLTQSARIRELMSKYECMDLADATLVVLSERYPRAKLITIDEKDFTIYRRCNGLPVPCIMPPKQ